MYVEVKTMDTLRSAQKFVEEETQRTIKEIQTVEAEIEAEKKAKLPVSIVYPQ